MIFSPTNYSLFDRYFYSQPQSINLKTKSQSYDESHKTPFNSL